MAFANRIKVLVLHHDPIAKAGLQATFTRYTDLEVVNLNNGPDEEGSTDQLQAKLSADVVVADHAYGIELATRTKRSAGSEDPCKVVIVAASDREFEIRNAMERGVRGYLLHGCALNELAASVRAVHLGVRYLSPAVAQRLAESLSGETLTGREEEVLRLLALGMNNKTICRRLDIAAGTVKSHLQSIFDKLKVNSRTQAISVSERRGLLRDTNQWINAAEGDGVPSVRQSQLPYPGYAPHMQQQALRA